MLRSQANPRTSLGLSSEFVKVGEDPWGVLGEAWLPETYQCPGTFLESRFDQKRGQLRGWGLGGGMFAEGLRNGGLVPLTSLLTRDLRGGISAWL